MGTSCALSHSWVIPFNSKGLFMSVKMPYRNRATPFQCSPAYRECYRNTNNKKKNQIPFSAMPEQSTTTQRRINKDPLTVSNSCTGSRSEKEIWTTVLRRMRSSCFTVDPRHTILPFFSSIRNIHLLLNTILLSFCWVFFLFNAISISFCLILYQNQILMQPA